LPFAPLRESGFQSSIPGPRRGYTAVSATVAVGQVQLRSSDFGALSSSRPGPIRDASQSQERQWRTLPCRNQPHCGEALSRSIERPYVHSLIDLEPGHRCGRNIPRDNDPMLQCQSVVPYCVLNSERKDTSISYRSSEPGCNRTSWRTALARARILRWTLSDAIR
jgi:hypothetical protein